MNQSQNLDLTLTDHFNRFWILKSVGEKLLNNQSPFIVQKLLDTVGQLEEVKKLRSGDYLIKVDNIRMSRKLEQLKNLGEFRVEVEPHKTLNYVKGVISHPELAKSNSEEVVEHLKHLGVTDAYCVTKTIDGAKRKTGLVILTFRLAHLPKKLKAGFLYCTVWPYVPNPIRCYKCQKFGHLSGFCSSRDTICGTCGEKEHEGTGCLNTPCCVNCKGEHPSNSRDCPIWKAEKDIQKIKTDRDLPYKEAKKIYELEKSHSRPYAVVATSAKDTVSGMEQMMKQMMEKLISLEKRVQQMSQPQVTPSVKPTLNQEKTISKKETEKPADDQTNERKRVNSGSPSRPSEKLVKVSHLQNTDTKIPPNPNFKNDKQKFLQQQKELNEKLSAKNKNGKGNSHRSRKN